MATITTALELSGQAHLYEKGTSVLVLVADTLEVDAPIPEILTHCFVGIQQFDTNGDPVVAASGDYAISVKTVNSEQWEAVSGSPIDASAPVTLNFAANVSAIRVVPNSPSGGGTPTHYRLILTANGR